MLQIRVRQSDNETASVVNAIVESTGIEPLAASILIRRGFDDERKAKAFLAADVWHDPFLMDGMDSAVELIRKAQEEKWPVTVYGDYDCDGTCAASILYLAFVKAGIPVHVYIPDRHTEGYGLNETAIRSIAVRGGLLITVDCGITNQSEVELAQSLGLQVIVTDHHQPLDKHPPCVCLNPPAERHYPFSQLCGAGIALKLVHGLFGKEAMLQLVDLAAIATVADLVPLLDENRSIVKMGLQLLSQQARPGLKALMIASGLNATTLSTGQIAFGLAPRINAAGRMGDASRAFTLFTTTDDAQAFEIACDLDRENQQRQLQEQIILQEASDLLSAQIGMKRTAVAAHKGWQKGVIGIVASRITEAYGRPSAVIAIGEDGICTGSTRGIKGVHIFRALDDCKHCLLRYGGHQQAGGFSLREEDLALFMDAFESHFVTCYPSSTFTQGMDCDATLEPQQISIALAKDMEKLAPFGIGNPTPLFLMRDATMTGLANLGKSDEHLRVQMEKQGYRSEGLLFRAKRFGLPKIRTKCDFVGTLETDDFGGVERVKYILNAVRPVVGSLFENASNAGGVFGYGFVRCLSSQKQSILMEDAAQQSVLQPFGLLLCIHTPLAFERIRTHWRDDESAELLDVYFQTVSHAVHRRNTLIIAPNTLELSYPYSFKIDTDDEIIRYANSLQLDRDAMAKMYRMLLVQARKPMDLNQRCSVVAENTGVTQDSVGAALAVFEELDLIRMEALVLNPIKAESKRNLDDSMLYNTIRRMQRGEKYGA